MARTKNFTSHHAITYMEDIEIIPILANLAHSQRGPKRGKAHLKFQNIAWCPCENFMCKYYLLIFSIFTPVRDYILLTGV